jgi:hypothetical protein
VAVAVQAHWEPVAVQVDIGRLLLEKILVEALLRNQF